MHKPPVLKRLTCRKGDTQFLAVYHFLVNSIYYSNNSKGNEDYLNNGLEFLLNNIRYNTELRTRLVLHTDRVYTPGYPILKDMITGSNSGDTPYNLVTWENAADDLTILVKDGDSNSLKIDLFSYRDDAQDVIVRPWRLQAGKYKLSIEGNGTDYNEVVTFEKSGQRIHLAISPHKLVELKITRM